MLTGSNTYTGVTTGALQIQNAGALGTTTEGTVVNGTNVSSTSNARLELDGEITATGESITINSTGNFTEALTSTSGNNEWAGGNISAMPEQSTWVLGSLAMLGLAGLRLRRQKQ